MILRRNGLNIPSSFSRITRLDINFHPYVLVERHLLKPQDSARRPVFCQWFIQQCNQNQNFFNNFSSSDEAVFSLNSEVNTRNVDWYAPYGSRHSADHYVEHMQGTDQVKLCMGWIDWEWRRTGASLRQRKFECPKIFANFKVQRCPEGFKKPWCQFEHFYGSKTERHHI